jgi:hypothetical protein
LRDVRRAPAGAVRQEARTEQPERSDVTAAERLKDIEQKLRCWGYLSHYREAECDVAWLLDQLEERDVRIAALEARLWLMEWTWSLP